MLIQKRDDAWIVVNYYGKKQSTILSYQAYAEFSQQGNIKIVLDYIDVLRNLVSEEDLILLYTEVCRDGARLWIPLIFNGVLT